MLLPDSKGKSWFWKFRHILYKLEEYFLASNVQRAHLERIFCHYLYFHDFYHAEQLASEFGGVNLAMSSIMIGIARPDHEVDLETLLYYRKRASQAPQEPWVLTFQEVLDIMIAVEEKRHLSLESY